MSYFMRVLLLIVVVAVSNTRLFSFAMFDLDSLPTKSWGTFLIVAAQVPNEEAGKASRDVIIERVLYGRQIVSTTHQTVYFDRSVDMKSGCYILILEYSGDKVIYGRNGVRLGWIVNCLPIKSVDDPVVNDVQMIIFAATTQPIELKLKILDSLLYSMSDRPLVLQYILIARDTIQTQYVSRSRDMLYDILMAPDKYSPRVILTADQLYIKQYVKPGEVKVEEQWTNSATRRQLLDDLDQRIPKDDPIRADFDRIYKTVKK